MPFTFSHPALIIPLLRRRRRYRWLSATGLIMGSIAPDFEKFLRLKLANGHSHTLASIFYFSCPVALALAFVFHGLVRRPLLAHLPAGLHRRLSRFASFDWPAHFRQHRGGVLLSIILGAALHLFWDLFTHGNWLMLWLLPGLAQYIEVGPWKITGFEVLGLISSVAGGLAVGWAVWKMPAAPLSALPAPAPAAVRRYWGLAALVALVLAAQWVLAVQPRLLNIGITAISAAMLGVVAASVYAARRPLASRPG